jgi:tRNA threonylcarbamoyladenosine biosynthesis protein TsaE
LIEWPDKGASLLAPADLHISIEYKQAGRVLSIQAKSAKGSTLLKQLN